MSNKGILADMHYCTGCHACEIACKQENSFPVGISGIKITEIIMEDSSQNGKINFDYIPYFSRNCDLCSKRIISGEDTKPACVKHCGTASLHYGEIKDLCKMLEDMPRGVLYNPN